LAEKAYGQTEFRDDEAFHRRTDTRDWTRYQSFKPVRLDALKDGKQEEPYHARTNNRRDSPGDQEEVRGNRSLRIGGRQLLLISVLWWG
jgi:hypothetical protein